MASAEKVNVAPPPQMTTQSMDDLRRMWQHAIQDDSPEVAAEEVLNRLERKYQALADASK